MAIPLAGIALGSLARLGLGGIGRLFGGRLGAAVTAGVVGGPIVARRAIGGRGGAIRLGAGAIGGGLLGAGASGGFGGGDGGVVSGPISELQAGMIFPDGLVIGNVWSTNREFNNMGQSLDGKKGIALRTNGTVRVFTYKKHIVVSSNPRVATLSRAARRLDTMTARLVKTRPQAKRAGENMRGKKR